MRENCVPLLLVISGYQPFSIHMKAARLDLLAVLFAAFMLVCNLHAQPLVTIDTVTVGDAGNAADTTGYGAVAAVFAIGKYEVNIGQYTIFLNSVASVTSNGYIVNLWNENMSTGLNTAGISRSGSGILADPYVYSVIGPSGITPSGASSPGNRPISFVSWFDAARFCNWLHNGATNGASTESGAYALNGATTGVITKNVGGTWWIPSEDEWYKAAYYKGGGTSAGYWLYPTQSDTAPGNTIGGATNQANYRPGRFLSVTQSTNWSATQNHLTDAGAFSNSASAYGTYDQCGNVFEWNDAVIAGSSRGFRGGSKTSALDTFLRSSESLNSGPTFEVDWVGFRVASAASTNIILTVEKSTNLSGQWQFDRDINVGPMTNTNEFYRLKIRTVVD